ncbi:hypothetical protein [Agromyces archimandritae]|uniref:MSP domain-containing protein n=1 Tax=Agromyces archimandritae TaxID=2781962 RepID=A0A975FK21_9MICO|nr:hypothetical protein [Agromyces archimandritae]QTX03419.1 hypothetical protein G127AT_08545 [Agromyces archimandritae]
MFGSGQPGRRAGIRTAAVLAGAFALAGLAGCAAESQQHNVDPPVIVDLNEVDGTTVEVQRGGAVDLIGDDETYTAWEADIADPAIVTFLPGRDDGSAQYNPGLTAESVGTTDVTLDNADSGETVTFTVEVTEH